MEKEHNDLEKEKDALFAEMLEELEKCKTSAQYEGDLVLKENKEMKKYIKRLERAQTHHVKGTPIPQLQSKQAQNRKLKELKTRTQKALFFVSLFGLELECLKLRETNGSRTFSVGFQTETNTPTQSLPYGSGNLTPLSILLALEMSAPLSILLALEMSPHPLPSLHGLALGVKPQKFIPLKQTDPPKEKLYMLP